MKITTVKNYLSNDSYLTICDLVKQENFYWSRSPQNFLYHALILEGETVSDYEEICELFKDKIDRKIKTASACLIPQRSDKKICQDITVEPLTIIYDLTTCNGKTVLPNSYEFKSIENSAIIINVKSRIQQIPQSDSDYRIVLYLSFN
jgi:hypothetical protein|tara:strand:+ start:586 stop:1029 length:444 start_codon:yes stop_codon:yes gene_type:complete